MRGPGSGRVDSCLLNVLFNTFKGEEHVQIFKIRKIGNKDI